MFVISLFFHALHIRLEALHAPLRVSAAVCIFPDIFPLTVLPFCISFLLTIRFSLDFLASHNSFFLLTERSLQR